MRHIILALTRGRRGSNQMTSVLCSQEQLNSRFRCVGSDICWGRRENAASRLFSINHLLKQRSRMCTCWCRFQWRANKIHGIQMNTFKTSRVRVFPLFLKRTALPWDIFNKQHPARSELCDRYMKHPFSHWCYSCENCTKLGATAVGL